VRLEVEVAFCEILGRRGRIQLHPSHDWTSVNLGYGILPGTMGSVSWQGNTNENGQAFGLWAATPHSVAGSGLLRVDAGGVIGTTPVTLAPGQVYLPTVLRNVTTSLIKNSDFSRPNLESRIRAKSADRIICNRASCRGQPGRAVGRPGLSRL
jgi:hypothetical protein